MSSQPSPLLLNGILYTRVRQSKREPFYVWSGGVKGGVLHESKELGIFYAYIGTSTRTNAEPVRLASMTQAYLRRKYEEAKTLVAAWEADDHKDDFHASNYLGGSKRDRTPSHWKRPTPAPSSNAWRVSERGSRRNTNWKGRSSCCPYPSSASSPLDTSLTGKLVKHPGEFGVTCER